MIKLKLGEPKKDYVKKYENIICILILFFLIALYVIYKYTKAKHSIFDNIILALSLIVMLILLYSCVISWNKILLMVAHFSFIIILFIAFFSKNNGILFCYLLTIILTLLIWKFNNNRCIFDRLILEIEIFNKKFKSKDAITNDVMYWLLAIYIVKMIYNYYNP